MLRDLGSTPALRGWERREREREKRERECVRYLELRMSLQLNLLFFHPGPPCVQITPRNTYIHTYMCIYIRLRYISFYFETRSHSIIQGDLNLLRSPGQFWYYLPGGIVGLSHQAQLASFFFLNTLKRKSWFWLTSVAILVDVKHQAENFTQVFWVKSS